MRLRCMAMAAASVAAGWSGGCAGTGAPVEAPPSVERHPYGTGTPDDAGVFEAVAGSSAGVRYEITGLDPDRRYELTTDAGPDSAGLMVTLIVDEGAPQWMAAPDRPGPLRVLTDASSARLITYTDHGGRHRAPDVRVRACEDCMTDEDLRGLVLDESPGLGAALEGGDLATAARELLRWSVPAIAWADSDDALIGSTAPYSAATLFSEFFEPGRGGVYCGGAADFYAKVLRLFGIDAFTVDFGSTRHGLTHVTTVVPIDGEYFMYDPTFGVELRDDGRPVPLLDATPGATTAVATASLDRRRTLEDGRTASCAEDRRSDGCGLESWVTDARAALLEGGFRPGFAGLLELFTGPGVFAASLGAAPPEFRAAYAASRR